MSFSVKNISGALKIIWKSSPLWSIINIILSIVKGILPLLLIYIVKLVIDSVDQIVSTGKPLLTNDEMISTFILAGLFFILNALAGSLNSLIREKQSYLVNDYIQNLIHKKTINIPYKYFEDSKYQNLFYRAIEESSYRPSKVFYGILGLFQNSITLGLIVGILMTLHWGLLPYLMLVSIPIIIFKLYYSKLFYNLRRDQTEDERKVNYFNRLLTSKDFAKELRIFNLGQLFKKEYESLRGNLRSKQYRLLKSRTLWETGVQILATIFLLVVFGFIIYRTINKEITSGDMAMYFLVLHRGYTVLQEWLMRIASLFEDNLFLKNFFEFLQIEVKKDVSANLHFPKPIKHGIEFNNVSFKYPNTKRWVLKDLNFTIKEGETVAIVGSNGAGKTTLVKLLAGLYKPTSGTITVDDTDWTQIKQDELADAVSVIFQDFMLYNVSAKKNIWYGNIKHEPDDISIHNAAQNAGIHEMFMSLPKSYDTILGTLFKNSEQLSRGEWQRTALARSFFNKAQLIILDEPTSSLDAFTESNLINHFKEITNNRTSIIISHRMTTIKLADRIVVIDGNSVCETGSHEELLSINGTYKKMIDSLNQ